VEHAERLRAEMGDEGIDLAACRRALAVSHLGLLLHPRAEIAALGVEFLDHVPDASCHVDPCLVLVAP
jgi:hypothetical protein